MKGWRGREPRKRTGERKVRRLSKRTCSISFSSFFPLCLNTSKKVQFVFFYVREKVEEEGRRWSLAKERGGGERERERERRRQRERRRKDKGRVGVEKRGAPPSRQLSFTLTRARAARSSSLQSFLFHSGALSLSLSLLPLSTHLAARLPSSSSAAAAPDRGRLLVLEDDHLEGRGGELRVVKAPVKERVVRVES